MDYESVSVQFKNGLRRFTLFSCSNTRTNAKFDSLKSLLYSTLPPAALLAIFFLSTITTPTLILLSEPPCSLNGKMSRAPYEASSAIQTFYFPF